LASLEVKFFLEGAWRHPPGLDQGVHEAEILGLCQGQFR
jgi:hypothetical protein